MQKIMKLSWKIRALIIVAAAIIIAGGIFKYAQGSIELSFGDKETTCQKAVTKWENANPDQSNAKELFTGEPAKTHIKDSFFIHAKDFESDITKAVEGGANFSGHYTVAQWSCGDRCQRHAIVDLTTGKIVAFGIPSEAGVSTADQYSVLITNPKENLPTLADLNKAKPDALAYLLNLPREYYVLEERGATTTLKKICTENPFEGLAI
jgi:hypothetical protein